MERRALEGLGDVRVRASARLKRPIHGFDRQVAIADDVGDALPVFRAGQEIESFFRQNTSVEDLDLQRLSSVVNRKAPVKLTVIRNRSMAEQINKSILALIS